MRLKKELINVKSFVSNYCICEGNVVNIYNEQEIENIKNQNEVLSFGKDNIITRDIRGNSNVIDLSNGIINNSFKIDAITYPYFTFYEFNNLDKEGVFDSFNQKILFETKDWFGRDIIDNYIFTDDVTCRNINNGDIIWNFDLQSIPNNPYDDNYDKQADWQVKKFIGILENKLWVALNHHTIIALDIESGALLHQLHDILTFKSEWLPSAIPLSEATVIDEKNNKLIGFMWEFYWEINSQNGEIILLDLTDNFLVQKVRNDLASFVLTDSHIYFASHHDIKIAAFNRQTKQIDWFHEFEDDGNGYQSRISKIDGNDDKLGVLTQGKVLYIFEKDS